MKNIIRDISLFLFVIAVAASCYRKPLYDECICDNADNRLSIPIDIDWNKSGVSPQNVTVLFYDSEDLTLKHEHTYEQNEYDIQSYVQLPAGSYKAVIFNELRDQIDYVSCVDSQNLETLKFESNNNDNPLRSRSTTRSYVEQPGDLAIAMVDEIIVTDDMIVEMAYAKDQNSSTRTISESTRTTIESLMGVETNKRGATIIITAHIDNIYYARMPALVDLTNLADGYYVFGDMNSKESSTLQFSMNNRTYDKGSKRDGTISATLTAFGSLEDRFSSSGHDDSTPIILDMLFQLIDEDRTESSLKVDVTDDIVYSEQSDGSVLMTIDIDINEALPEVTPEGSGKNLDGDPENGDNSGFGSSVLDWGEVDVPLLFD